MDPQTIENIMWLAGIFGVLTVGHLYAILSAVNKSTKLLSAMQEDLRLCLVTYFHEDDEPSGITTLQTLASSLHAIEHDISIIRERGGATT